MKRKLALIVISTTFFFSCQSKSPKEPAALSSGFISSDSCKAMSKSTDVSCKLTTPELQIRRETVLENLKKQMVDKKELSNGYAFKFSGSDKVVDELIDFIKSERVCCDFFTFNLSIAGDKSEAWMELTGSSKAKELIKSELGL